MSLIQKLVADPIAVLKSLDQKKTENLIKKLDKAFFVDNAPLTPDSVYDIVRKFYKKQYPQGTLVNKIGAKNVADTPLVVPMASLDQYNAGTAKLAKALEGNGPFVVTDKLDGQSIELVYRGARLTNMMTRGTSTHGTDRSYHVKKLPVPQQLKYNDMVIRVEAIIPTATFDSILHKDNGTHEYTAARNAAGGLINSQATPSAMKHVNFVAFEILKGYGAGMKQSKQLDILKDLGFKVPHSKKFTKLTEAQLIAYLDERVRNSPYEIDGLVVAQDVAYAHTGASNPKHAFKFKMNVDAATALVPCTGVTFQMSKFGVLTPVIHYEPTKLAGGAMCAKATGHNGFYIEHGYLKDDKNADRSKKRPIGNGAVLKIVRSGSVIPYIMEVVRPAKKAALPDVPFERKGVDFVAVHDISQDIDVQVRRINDFFVATGVRNIGAPSIRKLIETTSANTLHRILISPMNVFAPALGLAKARALDAEIDRVLFDKGARIEQLFTGLSPFVGLEGMGETNWAKVLPMFGNDVEAIAKLTPAKIKRELAELTELKSKIPLLSTNMSAIAKMIRKYGLVVREFKVTRKSKLAGQTVLFTGFRDAVLKERAMEAGASVAGSMTKAVTILVASDPNGSSAKLDKARDAGVKVIGRQQFEAML